MPQLPQARIENILVQDLAKETLIYDLILNRALCLNETSKIIWQACDGKTTFDEFRRKTNLQFSDELIWLALDQLKRDNLLDKNEEIAINFNGLNRREVIRKIGLATVIVLPIISSIVAPSLLAAQSGGNGGCSVPADCPTDNNVCTFEVCSTGVCISVNVPNGTLCSVGANPQFCLNGIC